MDSLFKELSFPKLAKLLKAELGDPRVLDGFRRDPARKTHIRARGPKLITHIFAGNVPNPSILSFVFGMLLKSANAGKLSSRDDGFLGIYLESLRDFDKALAASQHLIDPKNRPALLTSIQKSDLVVAYGTNQSLKKIREEVPSGVNFVGYGHRVSFAFFSKEVLRRNKVRALARLVAHDIWMMDRRGCLSPEMVYAEKGGEISPRDFYEYLMKELEKIDFSPERLYQLKNWLKVGQIHGDFFENLKKTGNSLQCVAVEALSPRRESIAEQLSALGANRICRAGQMQAPPITWHHDGKMNLASWVTWTDLEE